MFDVVDSEDGYLLQKQAVLPAGSTPRHFLLTPDGTYMLVALKVESDIEIFAIDQVRNILRYLLSKCVMYSSYTGRWNNR